MLSPRWQQEIDSLLGNTSKYLRPVYDPNTNVIVFIGFSLLQIVAIDISQQTFTANAQITLSWDVKIWNVTDQFPSKITVPASKVWTPDIGILNGVNTLANPNWQKIFPVEIRFEPRHTRMIWFIQDVFTVSCDIDMTWFPIDQQTCSIKIGSVSKEIDQVDIHTNDQHVCTNKIHSSTEFILVDKAVNLTTHQRAFYKTELRQAVVQFDIQRNPHYYYANIVVPCMLLSAMSLMSLCLPPESGEKISLQITILLSYVVFLLLVSDITPHTSTVSILTWYLISIIGVSFTALLGTIFSLWLFHHTDESRMPTWLKYFLFKVLGCLLCSKNAMSQTIHFISSPKDGHAMSHLVTMMKTTNKCKHDMRQANCNDFSYGENVLKNIFLLLDELLRVKYKSQEESAAVKLVSMEWYRASILIDHLLFRTVLVTLIFINAGLTVLFFAGRQPDINNLNSSCHE